eukprot:9836839-Ditylum_brightwellii.AAC.1
MGPFDSLFCWSIVQPIKFSLRCTGVIWGQDECDSLRITSEVVLARVHVQVKIVYEKSLR